MKNKTVLSVLALLLAGFASWYFLLKDSSVSIQETLPGEWESYVDEKRGLEMEIPAGWVAEPLLIFTGVGTLDENKYGGFAFGSPETAHSKELTSEKKYPVAYSVSPNSPSETLPSRIKRVEDKVINGMTLQVAKHEDTNCYAYILERDESYVYFDACEEINIQILEHIIATFKFNK